MPHLILMRHAKSSWADGDLDDHDRPLNKRGRAAAPVMGAWLTAEGYVPEVVLCSSSVRTCETVALMRPECPALPVEEIRPGLYHAGPEVMMMDLRALPDEVRSALLVGHEPGIGALLDRLTGGRAAPEHARLLGHVPTGAIGVLEFEGSWDSLHAGGATLIAVALPRELMSGIE